ncbi:MAG: CarD family transcriptional regulator [Spirochaetales bacterium]|jgi:CarD family transcriptional regulator|nr:CarD family transcriptional regulator [Spirochaetales bacterium]
MNSAEKKPDVVKNDLFPIGGHIVYPLQGVGLIRDIQSKSFKGKEILYYIIYLDVTDMTVMIPVNKATELGIRAIVRPKEAKSALESISGTYEPVTIDWKMRYQMNLDLLKEGTVSSIASVVQALYHRSKVKELPVQERKLYDSALKILTAEISFSLDKPMLEVEQMIFDRLERE